MASGAEFRAGAAGDEKYAYDYTYLPTLAFAKSVPGLGFSLQWALLVGVAALRILVNLIALKIDSDLTALDRRLSNIVQDIETQQFTAAILALVGVISDIVRAYADAPKHEGGRIKNLGTLADGVEKIETRTQLGKILAIIIFTASAQHSAVNLAQASIMSFAPAMPLAGYSSLPSDTAWLAMLPQLDQALTQLNVGTLLGSILYTRLGKYGSGYFTDPSIQRALTRFQEALASIEIGMKNNGLAQTYPYLLPSLI